MSYPCRRCGECCHNVGLIPPALPDTLDPDAPEWLKTLVVNLRATQFVVDYAESRPCAFLSGTTCTIYEWRPFTCRTFFC